MSAILKNSRHLEYHYLLWRHPRYTAEGHSCLNTALLELLEGCITPKNLVHLSKKSLKIPQKSLKIPQISKIPNLGMPKNPLKSLKVFENPLNL